MPKNGVIKYYIFPKNIITTPKDKYNENEYNLDENYTKYVHTEKHYNLEKILNDVKSSKSILYETIINFFKILSKYDIKPYAESNSGFLEFSINIRFIKNNDKYLPIIHSITNYSQIRKGNFMDEIFITEYYKWARDCVIFPHFGIASHKHIIPPNYGTLSKYMHYNPKIQYSILEKIYLEFNSEKTQVNIYYDDHSAGHIKLHIKQNEIYVTSIPIIKEENIEINVIFMLMELLRAYYAPIQMFLLLKYEKKMDDIAFELEFAKKEDYYIKKC